MEICVQPALIAVDGESRRQAAVGKPLGGAVTLEVIKLQRRGGNPLLLDYFICYLRSRSLLLRPPPPSEFSYVLVIYVFQIT